MGKAEFFFKFLLCSKSRRFRPILRTIIFSYFDQPNIKSFNPETPIFPPFWYRPYNYFNNNGISFTARYKVEIECKITVTLSKNFARAFFPSKSVRGVAGTKGDKQEFATVGIFCNIHIAGSYFYVELKESLQNPFLPSACSEDNARSLVCEQIKGILYKGCMIERTFFL